MYFFYKYWVEVYYKQSKRFYTALAGLSKHFEDRAEKFAERIKDSHKEWELIMEKQRLREEEADRIRRKEDAEEELR